jgi:phosphate-selective porin
LCIIIAFQNFELSFNNKTFPNFASALDSARKIEKKVIGLNWYLNQNTKINLNYIHNNFKGRSSVLSSRDNEEVFLSRFQFKF